MAGFLRIIKGDIKKARKEGNGLAVRVLSTLYAEAQMKGKNDGNRESTDEEVLGTIAAFVKNLNELLSHPTCTGSAREIALMEMELLQSYLPPVLSQEEIRNIIKTFLGTDNKKVHMGVIMKYFKENHANQYDGKVVSAIVKEFL